VCQSVRTHGAAYQRCQVVVVGRDVHKINQDNRWHVPLMAYASDRDVVILLVDEACPIDVDGQTYFRGFYTWSGQSDLRAGLYSIWLSSMLPVAETSSLRFRRPRPDGD
jgi:hypothetical protein